MPVGRKHKDFGSYEKCEEDERKQFQMPDTKEACTMRMLKDRAPMRTRKLEYTGVHQCEALTAGSQVQELGVDSRPNQECELC